MHDAAHIYLCLSRHQTVWLEKCFIVEELRMRKLIDASLTWGVQYQTGFVDPVSTHNESVRRPVCSSAWASVLVLNFFHGIKRPFLFKSFSFSFTPEPLQSRQSCNLPAAAFVLVFQEAGKQCESSLIRPGTNETDPLSAERLQSHSPSGRKEGKGLFN